MDNLYETVCFVTLSSLIDAKLCIRIYNGLLEMFVFSRLVFSEIQPSTGVMIQQPQTSVITTSHLVLSLILRSAVLCFPKISKRWARLAAAGDMGITHAL